MQGFLALFLQLASTFCKALVDGWLTIKETSGEISAPTDPVSFSFFLILLLPETLLHIFLDIDLALSTEGRRML